MARYRMLIAYQGTGYCGWQRQPNDDTVQGTIEAALTRMNAGEPMTIDGASRTDSGVHAHGQIAAFDYEGRLTRNDFKRGLNALTPHDITVRAVEPAPADFHPRFASRGKRYRYLVWSGGPCPPHWAARAWELQRHRPGLDLDAMRNAAELLTGQHDFSAFRASDCESRTTVRDMYSVSVDPAGASYPEPIAIERDTLLAIEVRGNAFLKYMIRVIAGTLVEVGKGRRSLADVEQALESGRRIDAGITAPPNGLTLVRVYLDTDAARGRTPCTAWGSQHDQETEHEPHDERGE